jgi:hypothetical protein
MPSKKLKVDFTGVDKDTTRKASGRSKHIPEGDYLVKLLDADVLKSERTRSTYIKWKAQVTAGEHKGTVLYGSTSLKPEALWSLRNLIHAALGKNVAGKAVNFDPESLFGKIVGAAVEDNEYVKDGVTKLTSQINTFFPRDEVQSSDEDDEDDEEEEDEDVEEEDEDEDLEDVEVEDI